MFFPASCSFFEAGKSQLNLTSYSWLKFFRDTNSRTHKKNASLLLLCLLDYSISLRMSLVYIHSRQNRKQKKISLTVNYPQRKYYFVQ